MLVMLIKFLVYKYILRIKGRYLLCLFLVCIIFFFIDFNKYFNSICLKLFIIYFFGIFKCGFF